MTASKTATAKITVSHALDAADVPESATELRREVSKLLGAKKGIDESRAKRLRKKWDAYQIELEQNDAEGDESLTELFSQLRERIHTQVDLREKKFAQVEAKLPQLRASMNSGDVKQAQKLEQSIIDALNQITGLSSQRRQKVITELEAHRPKLHKLTEWRKWGTHQAREKMIDEIKNIHKSDATLSKIAQRIQQAREEWQEWDKGGEGGDKKLYTIFSRECAKAYKPCQAHFKAQKQKRQLSSQAREKICLSLEQEFEGFDWRDPDWKYLVRLRRDRISEWRKAGADDYQSRKMLQRRFDAILEKFDEKCERERQRNYKIREKLIAEVEQLAQLEDVGAAIRELATLKKQWLPTVPSSRSKEKHIWKRFTRACDQLYEKRDRVRKDFKQELKGNLAAREALCAEIEALCQGDAAQHDNIQSLLGQWKTRWEQAGEAPKSSVEKINTRYRNATALARKAYAKVNQKAKVELHSLLQQKSFACAELEALVIANENDASAAAIKKLNARWDAFESLPDELEKPLAERYQLAARAVGDEQILQQLRDAMPGNLESLHTLLLHFEILAELDSPPEFAKARMALQIERLSAAMGKGSDEVKSAEQLTREILLLGAVDKHDRNAVIKRFNQCEKALKRVEE